MVSRDDIFAAAENIEEFEPWRDDILKWFSTFELKEFFDDFARLRDFDINWKDQTIKFDDDE